MNSRWAHSSILCWHGRRMTNESCSLFFARHFSSLLSTCSSTMLYFIAAHLLQQILACTIYFVAYYVRKRKRAASIERFEQGVVEEYRQNGDRFSIDALLEGSRLVLPKKDPKKSGWWELYTLLLQSWSHFDSLVENECSQIEYALARRTFVHYYIEFRSEFRVPFPIFLELVEAAEQWFPRRRRRDGQHTARGTLHTSPNSSSLTFNDVYLLSPGRPVPVEIKVMASLKVLARALPFAELKWASNTSGKTCHAFFHKFVPRLAKEWYPLYVQLPRSPAEIQDCAVPYYLLGLPGAIARYAPFAGRHSRRASFIWFCCRIR